ncbi:MAG: hypothetical protein HY294_10620 [Candidatus Rokubacteria bacterium]|nr:hypothetical protein [Candidatus Rokubacteria bacterium]MBI3826437.1 hypothetical protein [Candidatus Rokubacteria bacterium]
MPLIPRHPKEVYKITITLKGKRKAKDIKEFRAAVARVARQFKGAVVQRYKERHP